MVQNVLRLPAVLKATGLSKSGIYLMMREGSFPAPINLGPRTVGWLESEIAEWQRRRIEARKTVNRMRGRAEGKSGVVGETADAGK